jgi:hypothetical protein
MAVVIILVSAALLVGLHVRSYTKISPIDELSHIDMLDKASRFQLVRVEDKVGQTAMREEACRGLDRDDRLPPCGLRSYDPQFFQEYGENSVARKFPVYYFLTGLPARFIRWATPIGSLVTAARLLNFVWLGFGLLTTWALMAELGIRRRPRVVALTLMATTPVVLHASATVNSDAVLLGTGGGLVLMLLRWERGALPLAVVLLAAIAALVTEESNLVVLGVMTTYAGVRAAGGQSTGRVGHRRAPGTGARILAAGLLGLLSLLGPKVLAEVHQRTIGASRVPVDPPVAAAIAVQHQANEIRTGPVTAADIASEVDALVTPVKNPYIPRQLSGIGTTLGVTVLNWLLLGAVLACLFWSPSGERMEALAIGAIAVMIATGPIYAVTNAGRGVFFVTPARFGLPLLPTLTALLASCLEKRTVLLAAGLIALLVAANVIWRLA